MEKIFKHKNVKVKIVERNKSIGAYDLYYNGSEAVHNSLYLFFGEINQKLAEKQIENYIAQKGL